VHADLASMNGPDRDLAEVARADLLAWLQPARHQLTG
jgi:hypothetical protein